MPDEPVVVPGDTPADPPISTPDAPAAASAPASATPGDTPPAASAPPEPPEWVRRRISEETERRQRAETQAAQYQRELELERQRLRAMAGLDPQPDPRRQQLRDELLQVFPELERLNELEALQQRLQEFEGFYWQQGAQSYMQRAFDTIAKEAMPEGQSLTPTVKRILHGGFVAYLEEDPGRQSRYLANDTSLVTEYFDAMRSGLFDPYKQRSTSAAANKAIAASHLPRSGPGATLVGRPKQTAKNFDELEAQLLADPRLD